VGLVDVAPTVLELLGRGVPQTFEGQSLLGPSGCPAVTDDRTVLLETRFTADLRGSVDGRYKVIRDETDGSVEIYDLVVDPLEQSDLAGVDATFDAERLEAVEARYGVWGASP
jgi:arylsulfatase A-like enzyme